MAKEQKPLYDADKFTFIINSLSDKQFDNVGEIFINKAFYNPINKKTEKHSIVINAAGNYFGKKKYKGDVPEIFDARSFTLLDPISDEYIPTFPYSPFDFNGMKIDTKNNIKAIWGIYGTDGFYRIFDLKTDKCLVGGDSEKSTGILNIFPKVGMIESYYNEILKYSVKNGEFLTKKSEIPKWGADNREIIKDMFQNPLRLFFQDYNYRIQFLMNLKNGKTIPIKLPLVRIYPNQKFGISTEYDMEQKFEYLYYKLVTMDDLKPIGNPHFSFKQFVYSDGYFAVLNDGKICISGTDEQSIEAQRKALEKAKILNTDYAKMQDKITDLGEALMQHQKAHVR